MAISRHIRVSFWNSKKFGCSVQFDGVRLLVRMGGDEFRNNLQVLHNGHDVGELAHIDLLAVSVVDQGG